MTLKVNGVDEFGAAWDDLRFPATKVMLGALSKPDFDYTNMGLLFPQNDPSEIMYIIAQIPHTWKLKTNLHPHIHFVQSNALTPVFKMDYRIYQTGTDPTGAFTTITATDFAETYPGSGSISQRVSFPDIDMSTYNNVSAMIDIKIYRNDNVAIGDVLVKEFDIHYQNNTLGSDQEYSKSIL